MKQHKLAGALALALGGVCVFGSAVAAQPDPDRVWIQFKPGSQAHVEKSLQGAGARVHHRFDDLHAFAASVPSQALQGLRNNPNVVLIEADAPRYPLGQTVPYGVPMVQAPQTVATGADGSGIKVCIIDSGIKANHEDFAGIAMSGYPSSWNTDSCGHGTHVAGTIAAANNSAGVVGVSPGKVSLHIVKVFDGAACGWSYSSSLVDAAQRCQSAGAKVINMSLGGSTSSTTEKNAFANLAANGILSIAAAGNDGNNRHSYPASYDSVMSVAAVDANGAKADFSQYTSQVEIAAPGVAVLSTYPFRDAAVTVGTSSFIVAPMEGSPQLARSGALVDGGRCTASGSWAGKVVLCERGDIDFAAKVVNAQNGGAVAAIVYNNASGGFGGTLGTVSTSIPSVSMSQEDGLQLRAGSLGATASVSTVMDANASGYAYLDGTSMATPHVSGVAAIVWSADPNATNADVRDALTSTAQDLGAAGRDTSYGYGLVQALAATEALLGGGGGEEPPPETGAPASLTAAFTGSSKGARTVGLGWSGGAATVDIWRNGSKVKAGVSNAGSYSESLKLRGSGTLTYQVCNAGSTSACSNSVALGY